MKILVIKSILLILLGINDTGTAQNTQLTVIGNRGSVPEQLGMTQLRSILKGEKLRWDNGVAVKIALMKTSTPIGSSTCQKIYNMSPNELNKYFLALVFQGKVNAPKFFTSESELKSYVASTPGAIGISHDASGGDLEIVVVDGKKQL